MGWYFRKSKSLGPFRLNFSKSGIGVSTGVKGARISSGPRGTYFNAGSNGIYYRKKLDAKKAPAKREVSPNTAGKTQYSSQIHLGSGSAEFITSDTAAIINRIKCARIISGIWLALLILSIILFPVNVLFLLLSAILIVLRIVFRKSFAVRIDDELDESDQSEWHTMAESLSMLKNCRRMWLVESSAAVADVKNNAGANQTINRSSVKSIKIIRPYGSNAGKIKIPAQVIQVACKHYFIIFMPSLILVIHGASISGYKYNEMNFTFSTTRFIEKGKSTAKDAEIVDWTWQYMNRNGTPDMRYRQNQKYPVYRYGTFTMSVPDGFLISFQLSNTNVSAILSPSFEKYKDYKCSKKSIIPQKQPEVILPDKTPIDESRPSVTDGKQISEIAKESDAAYSDNGLIKELAHYFSIEGVNHE
ncbi:MAG: DUF4236 domain-containing protein [Oscillospiraceae bacterium]|nr:DUF4236 domain-containing protein [Oscillospiraceae bacterium]